MPAFDKIVVVTQNTALEELIERYNTRDQARFYLEHMGVPFDGYQSAHDAYVAARERLKSGLPHGVRNQFVERGYLPNFLFGPRDLVVTLGRDGLVVNTAKYLNGQPLVGVNPDPARIDGVLLPFNVELAISLFPTILEGALPSANVTMAKATLNTGQSLYAVNDFFIGQRTHTSARYKIQHGKREEDQSSSGIIVSTGAGSTGWFRSILAGAAGITEGYFAPNRQTKDLRAKFRFDWDARQICFCVREPFTSRTSGAEIVFGRVKEGEELIVTSQMPQNGVIFSDGIEADALEFTSGGVLRVAVADKTLKLVKLHGAQEKITAHRASLSHRQTGRPSRPSGS
jgi:NAD kinase